MIGKRRGLGPAVFIYAYCHCMAIFVILFNPINIKLNAH